MADKPRRKDIDEVSLADAIRRLGLEKEPRRGFFYRFVAAVVGGFVGLFPFAAGLAVFLDPVKRWQPGFRKVRVTSMDGLPDDGIPRRFPVIADRVDAWNRTKNQRIGAVYLRRIPGSADVECFNAICPHAGCFVDYQQTNNVFRCPCHTSSFSLDGKVIEPSPSPRDLDSLATQIDSDGGIRVAFSNFYTGREGQDPK